MQLDRRTPLIRHVDASSEFVIDTSHLPLLITTWFGSPSLQLAETYKRTFADYVAHCRRVNKRFVILDDAMRAGRPAPPVRGCLAKIECPPDVVVERVVVSQERSIRGAVTALSWITGHQIKTQESIEAGVRLCLSLLDAAKVPPPRKFEYQPAEPSRTSR